MTISARRRIFAGHGRSPRHTQQQGAHDGRRPGHDHGAVRGLAVLLVEQNTRLALDATQRVYLIEKGAIKHEGRSTDLTADAAVRLRYLGV
jgi:hypothetical protein